MFSGAPAQASTANQKLYDEIAIKKSLQFLIKLAWGKKIKKKRHLFSLDASFPFNSHVDCSSGKYRCYTG